MQTVNVKKELFEAIPKEFQDGELLSRIHADSEANAALLLSYITKGNPPTVVVNILKGKKGKKTGVLDIPCCCFTASSLKLHPVSKPLMQPVRCSLTMLASAR